MLELYPSDLTISSGMVRDSIALDIELFLSIFSEVFSKLLESILLLIGLDKEFNTSFPTIASLKSLLRVSTVSLLLKLLNKVVDTFLNS